MEINKKLSDGGTVTLEVKGKLTASEEAAFVVEINEAIAQASGLIFDFEKVPYISSSGLRALVSAKKQLDAKGAPMSVINVSKDVKDVFEITGLSDLFELQ
ncbi:MAG: STAS domain-containing protein [Endomicrobium sp.]|jgi:anti-anti-sigma factor|nr:STAS domain-containing protein [Endomicrobium sp.]